MSDDQSGRLVGGPHDGVTFPLQGFWRYHGRDVLPEPAQRVLVDMDGDVEFAWRDSILGPALVPLPPLSVYEADTDRADWTFRYTGEVEVPVLGE